MAGITESIITALDLRLKVISSAIVWLEVALFVVSTRTAL